MPLPILGAVLIGVCQHFIEGLPLLAGKNTILVVVHRLNKMDRFLLIAKDSKHDFGRNSDFGRDMEKSL